jgi:hypothetical protein
MRRLIAGVVVVAFSTIVPCTMKIGARFVSSLAVTDQAGLAAGDQHVGATL